MLPDTLHEQIRADFPAFHRSVSGFIDQYGDRTVGELKLETVTMRLDPLVFYRYLKNYLLADLMAEPLTGTGELHAQATRELTTGLLASQSVLFRRSVWQNAGAAATGHPLPREPPAGANPALWDVPGVVPRPRYAPHRSGRVNHQPGHILPNRN